MRGKYSAPKGLHFFLTKNRKRKDSKFVKRQFDFVLEGSKRFFEANSTVKWAEEI